MCSIFLRRTSMDVSVTTKELLEAKRAKGLTFADLGKVIGRDEVWVAALIYGQAKADEDEAKKLVSTLELGEYIAEALTEFPSKGIGPVVPTDPLLYRFYEILQVYGMPMKAVIHEKFGDGIMSAIDFSLHIDKESDPKGDRVKVTMSGKFLSYKKF
jgi:cyanate lyase